MEYILGVIILSTEELALLNICDTFFKKRYKAKTDGVIFAVYIVGLMLATQFLIKDTSVTKYMIICVINLCWIHLTYKGNIVQQIFAVITWFVLMLSLENIVIIFLITVLNISFESILQIPTYFIVTAIISKTLLYTITYLFSRWYTSKKQLDNINFKEWAQMLIFPSISIVTLIALIDASMKDSNISIWILLDAIGILAANIATLLITGKLSDEKRTRQDNEILQQQVKLEMANVQGIIEAYARQRKLTHEFNSHIAALYAMAEHSRNKEMSEYLKGLQAQINKTNLMVKCNNPVVDAILNQKYIIAKKNSIKMEFVVDNLSRIPMENQDIVTILANALDNAIEASIKNTGEKLIKVKIIYEGCEVVISIQNRVDKNVEIKNNTVKTTKKDRLQHGYGIKNIKSVLEKYEHIFILRSAENWFKLTIVLLKQEIQKQR